MVSILVGYVRKEVYVRYFELSYASNMLSIVQSLWYFGLQRKWMSVNNSNDNDYYKYNKKQPLTRLFQFCILLPNKTKQSKTRASTFKKEKSIKKI